MRLRVSSTSRAHGGVARDDGRARELERLHHAARRELRHVDDDAEIVEPPHGRAAELRQPAVRLVAGNGRSRRIGERVVAGVIECEHAHAGLDVAVDEREVGAERVRVLEADQHGDPPARRDALDVVRRQRQLQALGVVGHEHSNARELGIDLGACSRDACGGCGAGRRLERERHRREPARHELLDGHLRDAVVRAIDAGVVGTSTSTCASSGAAAACTARARCSSEASGGCAGAARANGATATKVARQREAHGALNSRGVRGIFAAGKPGQPVVCHALRTSTALTC